MVAVSVDCAHLSHVTLCCEYDSLYAIIGVADVFFF